MSLAKGRAPGAAHALDPLGALDRGVPGPRGEAGDEDEPAQRHRPAPKRRGGARSFRGKRIYVVPPGKRPGRKAPACLRR